MNGITFSDYKEFPEKWALVTIRFRKDTGEMRLTYANELAMKTLKAGSTDYPDGAVFAKTGIHTGSDPQFLSSAVPKGIRRYQLMVKDKKMYSSTGGWGYGLFDSAGKAWPEDPKVTQDACYACHTIVSNRGDVFSEPFDFVKDVKFPAYEKRSSLNTKITFNWIETKKLPQDVSALLASVTKVRTVANKKLLKNVFHGTLDELKPILQEETKTSGGPAIFLSADSQSFVVVIPKKSTPECMELGSYEVYSKTPKLKRPFVEKFCIND